LKANKYNVGVAVDFYNGLKLVRFKIILKKIVTNYITRQEKNKFLAPFFILYLWELITLAIKTNI
jgi:hypothetical protein